MASLPDMEQTVHFVRPISLGDSSIMGLFCKPSCIFDIKAFHRGAAYLPPVDLLLSFGVKSSWPIHTVAV